MARNSVKTAKASTKERRELPRMKIIRSGTIVYGRARRTMYCVLLDISDGGAKLMPADMVTCPDRFWLEFADQPARDCKVVWREQSHLGVEFAKFRQSGCRIHAAASTHSGPSSLTLLTAMLAR